MQLSLNLNINLDVSNLFMPHQWPAFMLRNMVSAKKSSNSKNNQLTFSTILSLPAGVAYDLPSFATGEVSKSIVPGPTEDRAAFSIVVFITQEAVGVTQFSSARCLHVFGPLISNSKVTLCGDPADQTIWVVCKN